MTHIRHAIFGHPRSEWRHYPDGDYCSCGLHVGRIWNVRGES